MAGLPPPVIEKLPRLTPAESSPPCFRETLEPLPPLAAGDTLRIRSSGGADVVAFDVVLAVPEAPHLSAPADLAGLAAGEPWAFEWSGPGEGRALVEVRHHRPGMTTTLLCKDAPAGTLAVPAAMTALWPEDAGRALVQAGVEVETFTATEPAIRLSVTHYENERGSRVDVSRRP